MRIWRTQNKYLDLCFICITSLLTQHGVTATWFFSVQPNTAWGSFSLIIQYMQWECLVISSWVTWLDAVPLDKHLWNKTSKIHISSRWKKYTAALEWTWKLLLLTSRNKVSDTRTKTPRALPNVPTLVLIHWVPFNWQESGYVHELYCKFWLVPKNPPCPLKSISPCGLKHLLCCWYPCPRIRRHSLILAFFTSSFDIKYSYLSSCTFQSRWTPIMNQAAIWMSSKAIHINSTTVSALCQAAVSPGKLL